MLWSISYPIVNLFLEDLSSDEGEDNIYEPAGFTDDVTRYGPAYAKYKARVMADNPDLNSSSTGLVHVSNVKDMDEESVEGMYCI